MEWAEVAKYIRQWLLEEIDTSELRTVLLKYKESAKSEEDKITADILIENLL